MMKIKQSILLVCFAFVCFAQQTQKGKGTFYHARFWGGKTTSGEAYHPYKYTAAHRFYPFNSWVEITFPKTEKKTWVRINDRGPFVRGTIIDVSRAAAQDLGLVPYGVSSVHIRLLEDAEMSDSMRIALFKRDSLAVSLHPKPLLKKVVKKKRKKRSKRRA